VAYSSRLAPVLPVLIQTDEGGMSPSPDHGPVAVACMRDGIDESPHSPLREGIGCTERRSSTELTEGSGFIQLDSSAEAAGIDGKERAAANPQAIGMVAGDYAAVLLSHHAKFVSRL
jgi:hypothetical protein